MYSKLEVYVPVGYAEKVKIAISEAGAGRLGNYDSCIWETEGTGQFRPLAGSEPFSGTVGELKHTAELKLEVICQTDQIPEILKAMRQVHPYETPAFHYYKVSIED